MFVILVIRRSIPSAIYPLKAQLALKTAMPRQEKINDNKEAIFIPVQ
jgi:hypothetical protein